MPASPRSSTSSRSSGRSSPIHGFDSSAALILVPDADETITSTPFEFNTDDDTDDESDSQAERVQTSSVPPLSSITVFLYLLSPFLKLGAFLLPDGHLPIKVAVPMLLFFAALSAFTRQIWYMLARYLRRADLEEIILETFARERGREGLRLFLRQSVRFGSGVFRVLLSAVYFRVSVDILVHLLPAKLLLPSHLVLTGFLAIVVAPLYFAPTLAADRVIYATWTSVAAYGAWIACAAYSHAHGVLISNPSIASLGTLWQGTATIAFAFTTSSTIPLYAALRGTIQPLSPRPRRSQSFKLLSALSVGIGALSIIPLAFIWSSDNPADVPSRTLASLMAASNVCGLVLAIPSILIPTSPLPIPPFLRRATGLPLSRLLIYMLTVCLSLVPRSVSSVLSDILWILAFLSTYMLPAFLHITVHYFRRPLSIVIPPSTPVASSPSSANSAEPSDSRHDELLQRKERTLQRRRLGRRIVWDIGVWALLVPVGGGGLLWAGGRMAGRW